MKRGGSDSLKGDKTTSNPEGAALVHGSRDCVQQDTFDPPSPTSWTSRRHSNSSHSEIESHHKRPKHDMLRTCSRRKKRWTPTRLLNDCCRRTPSSGRSHGSARRPRRQPRSARHQLPDFLAILIARRLPTILVAEGFGQRLPTETVVDQFEMARPDQGWVLDSTSSRQLQ